MSKGQNSVENGAILPLMELDLIVIIKSPYQNFISIFTTHATKMNGSYWLTN